MWSIPLYMLMMVLLAFATGNSVYAQFYNPSGTPYSGGESGIQFGNYSQTPGFTLNLQTDFMTNYRPEIINRYPVYDSSCTQYSDYYRAWYGHGFYGGYYYGISLIYNIQNWFWNPMVLWLYGRPNPALNMPFTHPGVFFPTTAVRNLALTVSKMPSREQVYFRTAMSDIIVRLEQRLTRKKGPKVVLHANDAVISHYEVLKNRAVVIEGFVTWNTKQTAFKALLDLTNPAQDLLFVPTSKRPTDRQLDRLRTMNTRIAQLK